MEIDNGLKSIEHVVSTYNQLLLQDANEAESRKKVIDIILEDVLGWQPESDMNYEVRVSEDKTTTFADYKISTATTNIIVEAKKVGSTFTLPNNKKSSRLDGFLKLGEIGEAIIQVRDYCRKLSIQFAVVTNGSTWIVFPAIRTDGVPFEETQAKIFRNLEDIKDRFVEFWELLSRQRVIEGNLENELFSKGKISYAQRLISLMKEPGYRLGRNRLYDYLEGAVNLVFGDEEILEDPKTLSMCYVKNSERLKFDNRLQMHLSDIKPPLGRKTNRPRKKDKNLFEISLSKNLPNQLRSILLLGPVGAGKTTFIHYTRKVSAAHLINNKIIWLLVDFKPATEQDNPRVYIYNALLNLIEQDQEFDLGSWEQSIRPAYSEYILKLKRGVLKPIYDKSKDEFETIISTNINEERNKVEPFIEKILKRASFKYPVYLVIDNVDQLIDEQVQQKIFIESQSIARKLNVNLIMSLRDSTYLKHRNSPIFDAFQVDTIYIDPPKIQPVLSKRFALAKELLSNKKANVETEKGLKVVVQDLSIFFDLVSSSLLNEETGFMIEILSNNNVRLGLDLIREFLSSGHVSADKAIHLYGQQNTYRFPQHEFFKGAILGQRKYYREEESKILNLYDSKLSSSFLRLLRLKILSVLVQKSTLATYEGDDFEEITNILYQIGISSQDVFKTMNDLLNRNLIWTNDRLDLTNNSKILPTRLGGYMYKEMSHRFMYFEPCTIDSSIYDEQIWSELKQITEHIEETTGYDKIKLRIERARIFTRNIENIENNWIVKSSRYKLPPEWSYNCICDHIKPKLESEFKRVLDSANNQLNKK